MPINITADNLIYPYFVIEGSGKKQAIKTFPGVYRLSVDAILKDLDILQKLGITRILLFGIPQEKDTQASQAYLAHGPVAQAVYAIKERFAKMTVMTDVCVCAYTTHGHCGLIKPGQTRLDHGATLDALVKMALTHARSGVDFVAPSAMAKRQVVSIRQALDANGFQRTRILGYSAKFASNFYGPFRQAADSGPKFGSRKHYQLRFTRANAALQEIQDDIKEGADIVMVKPALAYLDIVRQVKQEFHFPLAAYNVSGEYAFVKYGAQRGLWDERSMVFEIISAIRRAGADLIITYHAKDIGRWIKE